jgi:hypothetical protein
MPCFFSGIFLVQALERNTLSCMIMDAHGQRRQLALTHGIRSCGPNLNGYYINYVTRFTPQQINNSASSNK